MKKYLQLLALAAITSGLISCEKTDGLKRKIGGTYTVSNVEHVLVNYGGCTISEPTNGDGEVIVYSVNNPGKMVFTNKKVIQGPASSSKYQPYEGYFEYDYEVVDLYGDTIIKSRTEYFQYDFPEISSGDSNFYQTYIYIEGVQKKLLFEEDDNGNPTMFSYQISGGNCLWGFMRHYVE